MTSHATHRHQTALTLLAAALVGSLGCGTPLTDITATASEDVGPFHVAGATVTERTLAAHVCLDEAEETDTIAERVLLQLRSKGYQRIELDFVPADADERRLAVWTPAEGLQMQGGTPTEGDNPCASHPVEAHE